jgi:hypothetical protein
MGRGADRGHGQAAQGVAPQWWQWCGQGSAEQNKPEPQARARMVQIGGHRGGGAAGAKQQCDDGGDHEQCRRNDPASLAGC